MQDDENNVVRVRFGAASGGEDAEELYTRLLDAVYDYEGRMLRATALGVLDLVKAELRDVD